VLEDAYGAGSWRLGDSDALMLEISHEIAMVAEELGNKHEARKAFSRVAEWGPAKLGGGHPAVTRARAYLGQDQEASVRHEPAAQPQSAPPASARPTPAVPPPVQQTSAPPAPQTSAPPAYQPPSRPTYQPSAPPAHQPSDQPVGEEPTTAFSALEEPTTALPPITPARPAQVQPPTPAIQQTWQAQPQPWPQPQRQIPQLHQQAPETLQPTAQPQQMPQPPHQMPQPQQPAPAYPQAQQTWHEQPPAWAPPPPQQPFAQPAPAQPYDQKAKRGLGIFAAIAAVLAAIIAVSALVFVLANRSGDKNDSDVPTLGGKPPTDVAIKDEGTSIKVSWQDPANGSVSFLVAMAQPGQQLKPVGTIGPGQTSYEINALSPTLNYCFAVVAVYRDNKFATSQQSCTDRPNATK
jgi:hypothetical protein